MSLSMILAAYAAIFGVGAIINWFWSDKVGFKVCMAADYIAKSFEYGITKYGYWSFWRFVVGAFKYASVYHKDIWNNYSKSLCVYNIAYNAIGLPVSVVFLVLFGIVEKISTFGKKQITFTDAFKQAIKDSNK